MTDSIASFLDQITKEEPVVKVYSKTTLSNFTRQRLLQYQVEQVVKLVYNLVSHNVAIDMSDTGVGKTYIASAVSKELKRRPLIFCPKTLIYVWINVLDFFGVEYYDIVNYETIRNGKTYKDDQFTTRIKAPYLEIVDPDPEDELKSPYKWSLPSDVVLIIDECHRCKDPSTDNGKLLLSTKQLIDKGIPVLMVSATICEKIADMKIPFYLFGIIPHIRNYNHYVKLLPNKYPKYRMNRSNLDRKSTQYADAKANGQAMMIYEEIKEYVARIKVKDLGDRFPANQIVCQQFMVEDANAISKAYAKLQVLLKKLKENPGSNHLAKIVKLKQEIELRKVPIFVEQAQLYLEQGKSVAIFVNYLQTLHMIVEKLNVKCVIHGDQSMTDRLKTIDSFQNNSEKIIVCQIKAGGIGISLHDTQGDHPRVSLLNFPDNASTLLQALGRIHRAGAKTPALQRIIFVANVPYESKIMKNINRRLCNLSATNNGELDSYDYLK